ncbi:MAG TPA: hypothetical protein VHB48_09790 [Chitinophagaceae bacterium]|jgi:hypothetical protein|nr:hypothetical protein [Chitinophagaceae bacterium]
MKFRIFVRKLLVPKTGIYIMLGTIIMFLTFFTADNALEIAISGIASIFIGIGVNNFTESETHEKETETGQRKIQAAIKVLEFAHTKIANTEQLFSENISKEAAIGQLAEIKEYFALSIQQLQPGK